MSEWCLRPAEAPKPTAQTTQQTTRHSERNSKIPSRAIFAIRIHLGQFRVKNLLPLCIVPLIHQDLRSLFLRHIQISSLRDTNLSSVKLDISVCAGGNVEKERTNHVETGVWKCRGDLE